ncbi:MAG: class I SAM-dependent methyltransferase, partial [Polaromonas sp.]|nr:class I SAM-dependent methyltransferase [Polaromonas sp.]
AQGIILTPENGRSTAERWQSETPYLAGKVLQSLRDNQAQLVMDFGCGVGRLSRELVHQSDVTVIGVDASASMRRMAPDYVAAPNFIATGAEGLAALVAAGLRYDAALSVWVLQHCLDPAQEIDRITAGLAAGGLFFVVDMTHRAVPTDQGWVNDGQSIMGLLDERLERVAVEAYAAPDAPQDLLRSGWMGWWRKH